MAIQTDDCNVNKLKICSNRDCTDKIKATCAQVSTDCGMSIEMTCITVKTTCKSERDRDASQLSAKRQNIHIQKRSLPSMKMFCHQCKQLLIISTCKHLRWNVMHHWPCRIKRET